MKNLIFLLLAINFGLNAYSNTTTRCPNDDTVGDPNHGLGRNAWAKKCGYLNQEDEEYLNRKGQYASFTRVGGQAAPLDANAPCNGAFLISGSCFVGCWATGQQLLFSGMEMPIDQAVDSEQTVTGVTSLNRELGYAQFGEFNILSFIAGAEAKDLYQFELSNGRTLAVTDRHPMVLASGKIIDAKDVRLADQFLDTNLQPVAIRTIKRTAAKGDVWNVRLESNDKLANIVVSEGVLSGSQKFQFDWSSMMSRAILRF